MTLSRKQCIWQMYERFRTRLLHYWWAWRSWSRCCSRRDERESEDVKHWCILGVSLDGRHTWSRTTDKSQAMRQQKHTLAGNVQARLLLLILWEGATHRWLLAITISSLRTSSHLLVAALPHSPKISRVSSHAISHILNEYTTRPNTFFRGIALLLQTFSNGHGAPISVASWKAKTALPLVAWRR